MSSNPVVADFTGCTIQVKFAENASKVVPPGLIILANALLYGFNILSPIFIAFALVYFVASAPKISSTSVSPDKLLRP